MNVVFGMRKKGIRELAGVVLAAALLATACTAASSRGASTSGSLSVGGSVVTVEGQAAPDIQNQEPPAPLSAERRTAGPVAPRESPQTVTSNVPASEPNVVAPDRCNTGFANSGPRLGGAGRKHPPQPMCAVQ
jgi:hypothetical protein